MMRSPAAHLVPSRARRLVPVLLCVLGSVGCAGGVGVSGSSAPPTTSLPVPTTASTVGSTVPLSSSTVAGSSTSTTAQAGGSTLATSTTTATPPPWWRPVGPEAPLRVWVIGDSLAETTGAALARAVGGGSSLVAEVDYVKGSGLVRSDLVDWPAAVAEGLVKREPEVIVCLLGANDAEALRVSGAWLAFGSPEWDAEYARRVGEFMDRLGEGAVRVYWVGVPVMADPEYDGRVRHINTLQLAQAGTRPQIAYIDAYGLLQSPTGGYAAELPDEQGDPEQVRLADGVHLSAAGAERLARAVLEEIAADWRLPG